MNDGALTDKEITALLGEDHRSSGENSITYYLGSERTIMDSEWLVLDFENGEVSGYSVKTD